MEKGLASPKKNHDFDDLEAGNGGEISVILYPGMKENPRLKWSLIRKVYLILCMQLLITSVLGCAFYFIHPIKQAFLKSLSGALINMFSVSMATIIFCGLMIYFRKNYPWNVVFMGLFTLANGVMIGLLCTVQKGVTLLEAAALIAAVTVALTLHTFWAARRGLDFSFLEPFLFSVLWLLIAFCLIRIIFPMGSLRELISGTAGAMAFSLLIILDTFELIIHYDYDDCLEAACALYLDVLNFFLAMLQIRNSNLSLSEGRYTSFSS